MKYNKSYLPSLEPRAFLRFVSVYRLIKEHNKKFNEEKVDYSLMMNRFADLSSEDIKKFTTGHQLPPYEFSNFTVRPKEVINVNTTLFPPGPASIDWRARGHVTPVKDQGYYCNSCWAYAVSFKLQFFHDSLILFHLGDGSLGISAVNVSTIS